MFRQVPVTFFTFNLNKYFVKHSVLVCLLQFILVKEQKSKSKQLLGDKPLIKSHAFKSWVDLRI